MLTKRPSEQCGSAHLQGYNCSLYYSAIRFYPQRWSSIMKYPALAVVSLVFLLGADGSKEAAIKQDLKDFQGTWSVESMELDGRPLPEDARKKIRLTIKGEDFVFDNGSGGEPGLYKIDPTQDPKTLDIVITKGNDKGKVYLVIYKFEGGKMIQCMELENKNRPKEFTGKAGSGCALEIWQREKP